MINPRATGYEVMIHRDGSILQSGMRTLSAGNYQDPDNTAGWITRAVVLQTYYPAEDERPVFASFSQKCVLCDVRTYGRYSREFSKVPVLQNVHGLFDEDIYIPRPSTQDIEGGDWRGIGSSSGTPTAAENLDGDHVLLGFLENDPAQPVILPYQLAHPNSRYAPQAADGRVRRFRFNGVVIAWDKDSNLTIDATEASNAALGDKGAEQSASGVGGKITLVTSDGSNKTSIQLNAAGQILLGADPASASTEPMVLGTQWAAFASEFLDQMAALCDACAAITAVAPSGGGPTSVPVNAATFQAIKAQLQSSLKAGVSAKNQLSDFIFGKKAY